MKTALYKHILVPTDGSTLSLKAARAATRLAARLGAKMAAVYVIPPYTPPMGVDGFVYVPEAMSPTTYDKAMKAHAEKALGKVAAIASRARVTCSKLAVNDARPWKGIVDTARAKDCDLIVMASHGRSGLSGVLLGSETTKVLTHSKTPVLVCR